MAAQDLSTPIQLNTAFNDYVLSCILGEGGAGRVYGGSVAGGGNPVAVKLLTQPSRDKRQRFKNETTFLAQTRHPNLVAVTDNGLATGPGLQGPFYVMPRYDSNLRVLMDKGIQPDQVLGFFGQILDGIEAAHLLGATHRDLKPENVLVGDGESRLAIADFGIASFTADQLATQVETGPTQRLANFMYAAPEQRASGQQVTRAADIYALGLMLNEMFTGSIPHGTSYRQIADVAADFSFLDPLVARMIAQDPNTRPATIELVKSEILKYQAEAVRLQRLSELKQTVIPAGEIDDPLAHEPPTIVGADWDGGQLNITLDRDLTAGWIDTLKHNLGSRSAVLGYGPERFSFRGDGNRIAVIGCPGDEAQRIIDHFKQWLPKATAQYRYTLEQERDRRTLEEQRQLDAARAAEEQRLKVNSGLRF